MQIRQTISMEIGGVPYSKDKSRGQVGKAAEWSDAIIRQTKDSPRVKGACILRVTFRLPDDKFPLDHPFGSDLDNLLKRLCDALQKTILSEAPGGDGAIVSIEATKVRVDGDNAAGASLEVVEFVP